MLLSPSTTHQYYSQSCTSISCHGLMPGLETMASLWMWPHAQTIAQSRAEGSVSLMYDSMTPGFYFKKRFWNIFSLRRVLHKILSIFHQLRRTHDSVTVEWCRQSPAFKSRKKKKYILAACFRNFIALHAISSSLPVRKPMNREQCFRKDKDEEINSERN